MKINSSVFVFDHDRGTTIGHHDEILDVALGFHGTDDWLSFDFGPDVGKVVAAVFLDNPENQSPTVVTWSFFDNNRCPSDSSLRIFVLIEVGTYDHLGFWGYCGVEIGSAGEKEHFWLGEGGIVSKAGDLAVDTNAVIYDRNAIFDFLFEDSETLHIASFGNVRVRQL